ncbi:MAG TPA: pyrroline-5-carboxylate reductase [Candidatus Baltobacteraceae bacterium]
MTINIGVIGLGMMGKVLVRGVLAAAEDVTVRGSTRSEKSAEAAGRELGIPIERDNGRVAQESDVIVLCVKPYQAQAILEHLAPTLRNDQIVISICASIEIDSIRKWIGERAAVIRAMPNTPCLVGEGMTVLAAAADVTEDQLMIARRLFEPLGRTAVVDESLMDGVTGLSGCGPAYGYLIIEALSEAGVKLGIPRATSTLLAAQTMLGAAKMVLERGEHPAALKDEVTTPAGCTIDGLMALEDGKLRSTLISGVIAAAERSKTLRNG